MKFGSISSLISPRRQNTGLIAEQFACDFLLQRGLELIHRNYHCRLGEIDLIFKYKNPTETIIFVEVRLKSNLHYGSALDSITQSKQRKITCTALYFLKQCCGGETIPCRFDVISFSPHPRARDTDQGYTINNKSYQLEWLQDAFECADGF